MGYIQSGTQTHNVHKLTVGEEFESARITVFPRDIVGSYVLSASTGGIAGGTGAGGILATFKNAGTNTMVIRTIKIGIQTTTGYAANNGIRFSSYFVRTSFTQGTTNGTPVTLTGDNVKKRTIGQATTTASVVMCTTAGITGDTATGEDSTPFATALFALLTTVGTTPDAGWVDLYTADWAEYPMVLSPEEGFRIKNVTAFPATGVVSLMLKINYDEVVTY